VAAAGLLLRSRKIRVVPSKAEREELAKCFGVHRHIYNECVQAERDGDIAGASAKTENECRALLTGHAEAELAGKAWKNDVPTYLKQQAVAEFFRAKKAAYANLAAGHQQHFEMGRRSKFASRQETIPFERYRVVDRGTSTHAPGTPSRRKDAAHIVVPFQRSELCLRVRGRLPRELRGRRDTASVREEAKVVRTRLGYYYVVLTVQIAQRARPTTQLGQFCALDPGVRTFQTWYTEANRCGKIGRFEPMQRLLEEADRLISERARLGPRRRATWRRSIRRRFLRRLEKVRNCIADLHHKAASWLARNFRVIFLPKFETATMLTGNLASRVCRAMQTWSHYRFKMHLASHAQLYEDVRLRVVSEAYTTRQCGRCGVINNEVGAAETFVCAGPGGCGLVCDRDYHAARNILQRNLPLVLG
jgi:hypothetical protein